MRRLPAQMFCGTLTSSGKTPLLQEYFMNTGHFFSVSNTTFLIPSKNEKKSTADTFFCLKCYIFVKKIPSKMKTSFWETLITLNVSLLMCTHYVYFLNRWEFYISRKL